MATDKEFNYLNATRNLVISLLNRRVSALGSDPKAAEVKDALSKFEKGDVDAALMGNVVDYIWDDKDIQTAAKKASIDRTSAFDKFPELIDQYGEIITAASAVATASGVAKVTDENVELLEEINKYKAANEAYKATAKNTKRNKIITGSIAAALGVAAIVSSSIAATRGGELNSINRALKEAGYEEFMIPGGLSKTSESVENVLNNLQGQLETALANQGLSLEDFVVAIQPFAQYGIDAEYLVNESGEVDTSKVENPTLAMYIDDYLEDVAIVTNVSHYVETVYEAAGLGDFDAAKTVPEAIDALTSRFEGTDLATILTGMKTAYGTAFANVQETQKTLRNLNGELADLRATYKYKEQTAEYWYNEYKTWETNYNTYKESHPDDSELQKKLNEANQKIGELTGTLNTTQTAYETFQNNHHHTDAEYKAMEENYKGQLQTAQDNYDKLLEAIQDGTVTEELKTQLQTAKETVESLTQKLSDLQTEYNTYMQEHTHTNEEYNEKIEELEGKLRTAESERYTAQSELEKYKQKCADYETRLGELQAIVDGHDAEVQKLKDEIERLEQLVEAFQSSSSQSQTPSKPENGGSDVSGNQPGDNTNTDHGDQDKDDSELGGMH